MSLKVVKNRTPATVSNQRVVFEDLGIDRDPRNVFHQSLEQMLAAAEIVGLRHHQQLILAQPRTEVQVNFPAKVATTDKGSTVTVFPKEIYRAPKSWAQAHWPNMIYWNEVDRGGHFAAMEEPALFVDDVRAFFRLVR